MRVRDFNLGTVLHVGRIRGVNLYVHWSVFLISALMLFAAIQRTVITLVALSCYLSVLLIHECGHMVIAQRRGYHVNSIELYPIHGRCCFQVPWSRYDHCLIAWGGVVAQLIVALPLVIWLAFFGYTRFEAVNAIIAVLGGYSLLVALFNLLPIGKLDGTVAWGLIPELFKRARNRRRKQPNRSTDWRTY